MKRLFLILILPLVLFGGLKDSLLHYYTFESNSINVFDTAGTDTGSFLYLPIEIDGKSGNSQYRATSNEKVSFDTNLNIEFGTTISTWFKTNDSLNCSIIDWSNENYTGLKVFTEIDSRINVYYGDGNSFYSANWKRFRANDKTINKDEWNHIVIQPINIDTVFCYLNGEKFQVPYYLYTATSVDFDNMKAQFGRGFESISEQTRLDEWCIFKNIVDSATIVDSLWNDGNGWFPFAADVDTFLIDWNGIDLDLIEWNGIDIDLIQSINGINLK